MTLGKSGLKCTRETGLLQVLVRRRKRREKKNTGEKGGELKKTKDVFSKGGSKKVYERANSELGAKEDALQKGNLPGIGGKDKKGYYFWQPKETPKLKKKGSFSTEPGKEVADHNCEKNASSYGKKRTRKLRDYRKGISDFQEKRFI